MAKFKIGVKAINENENTSKVSLIPKSGNIVFSKIYGRLKLVKEVAQGGEGKIFLTDNGLICKIYSSEKITINKYSKLELMVNNPVIIKGVCWPLDIILNSHNEFVGYIMNKAEGKPLQNCLFIRPVLEKKFPDWKRLELVILAKTILKKIEELNKNNIILGDINPLNILIKNENEVFFVDTDSYQIENFPCPVGTVNFTAPEIQNKEFKNFLRTIEHEKFAIATLLFMILLPGKPPYSKQGGGDPQFNIKKQDFSYPLGGNNSESSPRGSWRYIWSNLNYKLKESFYNVFKKNVRISSSEWIILLDIYLNSIKNNKVSNEIYPSGFKIVDSMKATCNNTQCNKVFEIGKKRFDYLTINKQIILCNECSLPKPTEVQCSGCKTMFPKRIRIQNKMQKYYCSKCSTSFTLECSECHKPGIVNLTKFETLQRLRKEFVCRDCMSLWEINRSKPTVYPNNNSNDVIINYNYDFEIYSNKTSKKRLIDKFLDFFK